VLTCVTVTLAVRLKELVGMVEGLSLRELAGLAGISKAYPSLIASGERTKIGGDVAQKLAGVLGCTIDFLLKGAEPAPTREQVQAAVTTAREARAASQAAECEESPPASEPKPAGEKGDAA
jgi:transcriptional regulator with XRE-family HTH domain